MHPGHFTNQKLLGDRFILPCISSNPIRPVPGAEPYTSRLWQYPVDENLTRIERFLCFRAENDAERRRILKALGDAALDEHAQWILLHRERSVDQQEIVRLS